MLSTNRVEDGYSGTKLWIWPGRWLWSGSALTIAVLLAAAPALAETDDGQATSSRLLEEVLVTAQRREQSLRDTPIAVNAISGEAFRDSAAFSFQDVDRLTAGLTVEGGDFDTNIILRGLGTNLPGAVSPRVTSYIDGAFFMGGNGMFLSQFDLARFEVLRGPQGTLFGKTSPAGAVMVHTRSPNLVEMDGFAELTYTDAGGSNLRAGASLPLIEGQLGLRVAGVWDNDRSSGVRNTIHGTDASNDTRGGRATLLYEPNDAFTSRLSYQYIESDRDFFQVIQGCGQFGCYKSSDRKSIEDFKGQALVRNEHAVWENSYVFNDSVSLTSLSFYQTNLRRRFRDDDALPEPNRLQSVDPANSYKNWNQELRLNLTMSPRWQSMVGAYYAIQQSSTEVQVERFRPQFSGSANRWLESRLLLDISPELKSEDWAVFTHNTFNLDDLTTLTVGLRWNRETRNASQPQRTRIVIGGNTVVDFTQETIPAEGDKRRFEALTGSLKLQRELSDLTTGYLAYDRGFRGGAANINTSGTLTPEFTLFDKETSDSFEVGLKMESADRSATLNLAAYYQIYNDFQFLTQDVLIGTGGGNAASTNEFVDNADEVVTKGAEAEGAWRVLPSLTLFGSLAYNDTKFTDYKDAPCNRPGATLAQGEVSRCDRKGERLGNQGNWSASVSSEYVAPVTALAAEWYLRGMFNFEGFRVNQGFDERLSAYGVWDFMAGLRDQEGVWEARLWVRNAFDKSAITNIEDRGTLIDNRAIIGQSDPSLPTTLPTGYRVVDVINDRTVGLTLSYNWK